VGMDKINVALVGVGNCAKSLVEGVAFYTKNPDDTIGLMHHRIGGYHPSDIHFVAAFDVDQRKVGKKLHEAIYGPPNQTMKISDPLEYDARVHRGPTFDGVIDEMRGTFIQESPEAVVAIADTLKQSGATVVVNYLPTGSEQATHAYAEAALQAGCSFINAIPTPLAVDPAWRARFEHDGLVLMGDDIKSQLGATILNRFLVTLLKMRGVRITKSEQVNTGGNADHLNLQYRAKAKEQSKRGALSSLLDADDIKPTVRFEYNANDLSGHKKVLISIDGEIFGHIPISIVAAIEDEISINSAGVVVDAVRAARVLVDRGTPQDVERVAPFLMKSPPKAMSDWEAFEAFEQVFDKPT